MEERIFAVREELLKDQNQRRNLREYLQSGGTIVNWSVVVCSRDDGKIESDGPFCNGHQIHDSASSEKEKHISLSRLLHEEGERSSFFTSEGVLLQLLEAFN